MNRTSRTRRVELLALALLGLAFAVPLQPVGCNRTAHPALVSVPLHGFMDAFGLDTESPAAGRPNPEAIRAAPRRLRQRERRPA